jgi:methylase of polypeptide subunit release factors
MKYTSINIQGNRIREGLSLAVKGSLAALGNGFLQHSHNTILREKIRSGALSPKDYYRQLLRIIYRLLFLKVTEERDLVYDPEDKSETTERLKKSYLAFYSIARLRQLSENRAVDEAQSNDLWQGLVNTFLLFEAESKGNKLGIQPLDGDLFSSHAITDLQDSLINNKLLLECVRNLNEFTDESKNSVPINYRSLEVEELGFAYEGLLELHPVIENREAADPAQISFTFQEGTDRKTTGSYYTRPELVNELIKSALIPVIEERLQEQAGNKEAQARALLKLKVCDAAAGSGHILVAAARTIAGYLARVQSGEENPAPSIYRKCLREVIQHCIYAVDHNPDAVELCKLALWLEGHNSGKPLSFLDHKIRNGNSLVGVTDLTVLQKGIPDDAFNPVTGDDKKVCQELKKANAQYNKPKQTVNDPVQSVEIDTTAFTGNYKELENIQQDDAEGIKQVKATFETLRNNPNWFTDWQACNIWTAAFFWNCTEENKQAAPNSERLAAFLNNPATAFGPMVKKSAALSAEHKFFHWALEFPDVFEQGGFDVMLGNPPWESVQLEEKQYFETRVPQISKLKGSERKKAIDQLKGTALYTDFIREKHAIESQVSFIRGSSRFEKTAASKINTYQCFTELLYQLVNKQGRSAIIIPLGIVTEESSNKLFIDAISKDRLHSIIGFENEEFLFRNVANVVKFCLLTFLGNSQPSIKPRMAFHFRNINALNNKLSYFNLDKASIDLFNPKTKTSPLFRTKIDFELNEKIYKSAKPIFGTKKYASLELMQGLYNMTLDSSSFIKEAAKETNSLPLYESKFIWQYEHRFGSMELKDYLKGKGGRGLPNMPVENSQNPHYRIKPQYYVSHKDLQGKIPEKYNRKWFMVYRGIGEAKRERTFVSTIVPYSGIGNSSSIIFPYSLPLTETIHLLTNFNSLVFDYMAKQKIPGVNINQFYVIQIPIAANDEVRLSGQIVAKSFELIYASWDMKPFADDVWQEAAEAVKAAIKKQWGENKAATGGHEWLPPEWCATEETGCPLAPFKWEEDRRAVLKAELDAIYAKLYGLTTQELRYILDPQDLYGPDFPGETFRVLKEKEIRLYGEYRTKRLVLEAWEKM